MRERALEVVGLGMEALGDHLIQLGLAAAAAGALAVARAFGFFQ